MITTLIICVTVVLCLLILLKWIKDMSVAELPMFTYGECVHPDTTDGVPAANPIGFKSEEEEKPKEKTDKEIKDAYLKDPITLTASLLRGEVDIDDITT